MDYWEYKIVQLRSDGSYSDEESGNFEAHINDLGRLGWELDKVLSWENTLGWVVFRRPVPPEGDGQEAEFPDSYPQGGDIRNLIDPRT